MKKLSLAGVTLLALGFVGWLGASAAPPYTGNTTGTDSSAILSTLTDTYTDIHTLATTGSGASGVQSTNITKVGGTSVTLGSAATASSFPVTLPSNAAFGSSVSITRTNDTNAYGAGDIVGAATGSTAAQTFTLGAGAGEYTITCASIEIDASAIISGETTYSLYLYNVTPPSASGDNAAWDLPSGDRASWLGSINLGTPADLGSTLYVEQCGLNKQITTASASVFAYLVTTGAYTPTAQRVYVVTLHTVKSY